jgi:hypothetical protein
MNRTTSRRPAGTRSPRPFILRLGLAAASLVALGCAGSSGPAGAGPEAAAPRPDPRVGLRAGPMNTAGQATWNLRLVSNTPPPKDFLGSTNSDLAFTGPYVIQGNYNGFQVWDVSDPARPALVTAYLCPASQSDVSVYRHLLFVSAEGTSSRLDCGTQGIRDTVSADRIRGIRIFDISDIAHPRYVANVQTCRGSHTHTVVPDPRDSSVVYIYISGSAGVRSPRELPGCSRLVPDKDPNSSLFRIEVIRVPLAHPEEAAIVGYARIFEGLVAPPRHGEAPEDVAAAKRIADSARAAGAFTANVNGMEFVLPPQFIRPLLDSVVRARGGTGAATGADSAALREALPGIIARFIDQDQPQNGPRPGPNQCHDITVYPALGLAGGACGGYGLLLDIRDPVNPRRIDAVADSNFSYWHSATFNNDGTKILFSDEWGGGGLPKCRATDKPEWGADAIFTLHDNKMSFRSYYKLPAPQTQVENCVAHNGSLIPVPGRDIMVQGWYQGGVSVFDWTDPDHPREIAFFDRGPVDATKLESAGSWSAYWYNGYIYSSEIARGLDILELTPSALLTQHEIDAAKQARLDYLNVQQQPRYVWPATYTVAHAYLDQLTRSRGLPPGRLAEARAALTRAEQGSGPAARDALARLAAGLDAEAAGSSDAGRVRALAAVMRELASAH